MSGNASTVTEAELDAARRGAEFAARRRIPASRCPFDPAGDARQKTLASAWMRAYLHRNPPADGRVSYDDE
jgi:hypothetical protein